MSKWNQRNNKSSPMDSGWNNNKVVIKHRDNNLMNSNNKNHIISTMEDHSDVKDSRQYSNTNSRQYNKTPKLLYNNKVQTKTTKSLLQYRQRKEIEINIKQQQYKSYKKVLKREGLLSNKNNKGFNTIDDNDANSSTSNNDGLQKSQSCDNEIVLTNHDTTTTKSQSANRQHHLDDNDDGDDSNNDTITKKTTAPSIITGEDMNATSEGSFKRRHPNQRIPPLHKKKQQGQHVTDQEQLWKEQQIQKERERKEKLKVRHVRRLQYKARTSRGQPIMKHIANDILNKLQKEIDIKATSQLTNKHGTR